MSGKLDVLTSTVNGIIDAKKDNKVADALSEKAAITLEFNDDGDALLPQDALDAVLQPYKDKIESLTDAIEGQRQATQADSDAQTVINSIVGEDPNYAPIYTRYQTARKWVNDKVVEFQIDNQIQGTVSSGQALDHIFDDDLEAEFNKLYPELDLTSTVTAEDSKRHFKGMLDNALQKANPQNDITTKQDSRFKAVLNKPSGLGAAKNAKSGHVNISDKIVDFKPEDILNLSDAQIEALKEAVRNEEITDGIKF
jgi:hypothetical protein